jgi:hypothetical protein
LLEVAAERVLRDYLLDNHNHRSQDCLRASCGRRLLPHRTPQATTRSGPQW